MQILIAMKTYASGKGFRGSLTWKPKANILKALDEAFYMSFENADMSNKRFIVAVDVSGSMGCHMTCNDMLNCSETAGAIAMTLVRTEPEVLTFGFDSGFKKIHLTSEMDLNQAMRSCRAYNYGGTDCAYPMTWALANNVETDVFVVLTDNETRTGKIKPYQALKKYRDKTGIDAKLIVVGMVSNGFTIADPNDAGMLDVVGMDTSVPRLITDFSRGFDSLTVPRIQIQ